MLDNENLLFLLSSIGVLNSFALSFYFFYSSTPNQRQNKFLALLLLMLSVRIGKSVVFYFFWETPLIPIYLQVGLTACFLIGPSLYFYVSAFFRKKMPIRWWVHFLSCLIPISILGIFCPYVSDVELWRGIIIPIIYFQWFVYLAISGYIIWENTRVLNVAGQGFINKKTWVVSIFLGVFLVWLAYATNSTGLTSYIIGAVSFTFMIYLVILLLLMGFNKTAIMNPDYEKYGGKKISKEEQREIHGKLVEGLEECYTDPELTLDGLAKKIGVKRTLISQVLNEHHNINFSGFLRTYRVDKVKQLIISNDDYTIEAIGKECGFKAKSTFFTSFKQETGMTPRQYRVNIIEKSSDLEN